MKQKGTPQQTGSFALASASTPFATVSSFWEDNPKRWRSSRATSPESATSAAFAARIAGAAALNLDAMACRIFVRSPASSACKARAALLALCPTASSGFPSSKEGFRAMSLLKYVPTSSPARTLREKRVDGVAVA